MKTAVILAAGEGKRLWPYTTIRSKAMIPIGAKPLISYTVESLFFCGIEKIYIAANHMYTQINRYYLNDDRVITIDVGDTQGSAHTLQYLSNKIIDQQFLLLYGDMLYHTDTIREFIQSSTYGQTHILAVRLEHNTCRDTICMSINSDGTLSDVCGHPRGGYHYTFGGFIFTKNIFKYIKSNPGYFTNVQVGMMSPLERYLEMSVYDLSLDYPVYTYICSENQAIDINKPWDILYANTELAKRKCSRLTCNNISPSAEIDKSAHIDGYIQLGSNSRIGRNVIIQGNCIIRDNTIIENGAVLLGNNIVGSNCTITNYCYIDKNSVIGNNCKINHCAELSGVIFDGVSLYHYMEIYGIIGEHSDIGAATVCGSLRFDDGDTVHKIRGRAERPYAYSNAVYIGDFCRTGVNVIISPGKKIGCYSIVGAGTILEEDVPNNTLIYTKQDIIKKEWGPNRYGW